MSGTGNQPGRPGSSATADLDAQLEQWLGATSGPTNWRTVPSGDAPELWKALRDWVNWFRGEFNYDHRVVPPCWYQHPALVSVLAALHGHWTAAYDPLNSAAGASEWHRGLIPMEGRLRDWAARTGCTATIHRADVIAEYPDDGDAWRRHVLEDLSERTDREVAAATAEQDTPHGSRR